MPRNTIADHLQNFRFQLLDVDWGLTVPPFVFQPLGSFSSITTPEITLDTDELAEGNYWFKRHLITGGSISNITLSRGALFWDSEFWNWMSEATRGAIGGLIPSRLGGRRRNLLLIQFMNVDLNNIGASPGTVDATSVQAVANVLTGFGVVERAGIPARAWMLFGCLPVRYKVGSDFDATSSDVSIMELELSIDRIEEFGIAAI